MGHLPFPILAYGCSSSRYAIPPATCSTCILEPQFIGLVVLCRIGELYSTLMDFLYLMEVSMTAQR